jgi:VanZ family protein
MSSGCSGTDLMGRSEHSAPAWLHSAFVAYVLFMLVLFLLPMPAAPLEGTTHIDKVVHFGVFLGFAVLFHLDRAAGAAPVLLASVAFAAAIEVLQLLLPYREGDWFDWAAGAVGGSAGAALVLWRVRQRAR